VTPADAHRSFTDKSPYGDAIDPDRRAFASSKPAGRLGHHVEERGAPWRRIPRRVMTTHRERQHARSTCGLPSAPLAVR